MVVFTQHVLVLEKTSRSVTEWAELNMRWQFYIRIVTHCASEMGYLVRISVQ